MNYKVTNIGFKLHGPIIKGSMNNIITKVPKDIKLLQEWLEDIDHHNVSESDAIAAYIRSYLYYNEEMIFDLHETAVKPTLEQNEQWPITDNNLLWMADLADIDTSNIEMLEVTFDIELPEELIVEVTHERLIECDNDLQFAIFSILIHNMPTVIKVHQ